MPKTTRAPPTPPLSETNTTMSRHRVKAVSYDDDEIDYEDGYDSEDPDEREYLEQCTREVLGQLAGGDPSVSATREEVQEALWHYYNDVEKSVNYLKGRLQAAYTRIGTVEVGANAFAC